MLGNFIILLLFKNKLNLLTMKYKNKKYFKFNKIKAILLFFIIITVPIFSGCGTDTNSEYFVDLEIWGIVDESLVYAEIINQYKAIHPYIGEIKYKKMSTETYKQDLIDALASGQGPDIFLINNRWLPSFENKIEPSPTPFVSEQDIKNNFPDVVLQDFVSGGKAYAVPLSIDSLVLYYNKDIFNSAGITFAPKTWQDVNTDVMKTTILDRSGNIVQSGIAMGTANNINRAPDLLSVIMLQAGVSMPSQKVERAQFADGVVGKDGNIYQAGEQALGYYTRFSKLTADTGIVNPLYTWNSNKDNSLDAFSEGSLAMMLNYSWQYSKIKSKNPKLNFGIAQLPQNDLTKPVTYANYWGFAVSKNKSPKSSTAGDQNTPPPSNDVRIHEAWQFLKYLTTKNSGSVTLYNAVTKNSKVFQINFDPAMDYLKRTLQPAARRDIIDSQKTDSILGIFANSNLFAKSWYQYDPDAIDKIFSETIEAVNRNDLSLHDALNLMSNRVNYLVK